mgnify:CR=1 FL=1
MTSLYDATAGKGNQFTLLNRYKWDNGLEWTVNMKYDHALGSYLYQTPMSMEKKTLADGYSRKVSDGTLIPLRRICAEPYVLFQPGEYR